MSDINILADRDDIVAVADNIRSLTGTTGAMTLTEMATVKGSGGGTGENLDSEIATQKQLIADIQTALEGKAAGGSGGGASVETVEVNFVSSGVTTSSIARYTEYWLTEYKDGKITFTDDYFPMNEDGATNFLASDCAMVGTVLVVTSSKNVDVSEATDGLMLRYTRLGTAVFEIDSTCPKTGATITIEFIS